ncbi:MAG: hypothetical protein HRK26_00565 [Rickettsiaceae bacterium H1]|nr:hypothetical protein [Rickettsiaceae bacterium H1]
MYFFRAVVLILIIFVGLKLYKILPTEDIYAKSNAITGKDMKNENGQNNDNPEYDEERKKTEDLLKSISPGEAQALLHLSERHKELKRREVELHNRENLLEATRDHIEAKIIKLQEVQKNVRDLLAAYQKEEKERIGSWVKIYENMRPQDAAQIFDELEINTLLPVIDRMKEAKIALLLAKMRPEKARQITVKLANNQEKFDPKKYNLCSCE